MKSWKKPTPEQVERAVTLLAHVEHYRYFFDRLENPEWVEPLWKKGFFRYPPKPEHNEEQGTVRFPPWPEARYLARMARHKPELVVDIIQKMGDTDNAAVLSDLVEAALAMPSEISARLVEHAEAWAKSPYFILPEKLGELVSYWAKGGKLEESLRLARVVLDVLPDDRVLNTQSLDDAYIRLPRPRARFNVWRYDAILNSYYRHLVEEAGLPALELLCGLLEKAIRHARHVDDADLEDYSFIWRPAIEEHAQNTMLGSVENSLVSAIRDAAECIVRSGKASIEEVIRVLELRQWKVFRRVALHLLRVFPEDAAVYAATRLTDRHLFEDVSLQHEYVLLMRDNFWRLDTNDQLTILGWIEEGPPEDTVDGSQDDERLPCDELSIRRERWELERLSWVGRENLSEKWRKKYDDLVGKHGEPLHPDFPIYSEGIMVGPTSPITIEQLRTMCVTDIVTFLASWIPPTNNFMAPSPEGLARVLADIVAEEPQRFAENAEQFKDLDPTYVRALFSGFRNSLKRNKTFAWDAVLRLCRWVVNQPREIRGPKAEPLEKDPHWGWARKAIADLISEGFTQSDGQIPHAFRQEVWSILHPLTQDPDPTPECEQGDDGPSMDPATLSINTTRGSAIHAVIRYALWLRQYLQKLPDANERLGRGFAEMPEVRQVLNEHVDPQNEPSLAIRAIYGWWYPYLALLDHNWAEHQKALIFPLADESRVYFEAAWGAYIVFCKPYDKVFELLRDVYEHAVNLIGKYVVRPGLTGQPDKSLVEHLMVFYLRGTIDLKDPLFIAFWDKAPHTLRGYAIEFIGLALQQSDGPISQEITVRLQELWRKRVERAKIAPSDCTEEMAAFARWFISAKFDTHWSLKQLLEVLQTTAKINLEELVIERLAQTVVTHPSESIECLHKMIRTDVSGWAVYTAEADIRRILEAGLQHSDTRVITKGIIHYLGSQGFLAFRELLYQ